MSAISFGVFWRLAPSTRAIIRSMKVSPGFEVISTLIWSDRTFVPPVTALRSPPDSRMTGADSPVIADSSTVAAPSMTSPSPGISSPAETMTMSPFRSCSAPTFSIFPPLVSLSANVWVRVARNARACALPRPSAIASAKFAKRTVNQSQSAICSSKPMFFPPLKNRKKVVIAAPTSVTNITGFAASVIGLSFLKASPTAGTIIAGSKIECDFAAIRNLR